MKNKALIFKIYYRFFGHKKEALGFNKAKTNITNNYENIKDIETGQILISPKLKSQICSQLFTSTLVGVSKKTMLGCVRSL